MPIYWLGKWGGGVRAHLYPHAQADLRPLPGSHCPVPSTLWSWPRADAPWARVKLLIGPPAISLWRLQPGPPTWPSLEPLSGRTFLTPRCASVPSGSQIHGPPGLTRTSASGSCLAPPATSFWPLLSCPSQHPPRLGGILRQEPTEEALGWPTPLSYPRVHSGRGAVDKERNGCQGHFPQGGHLEWQQEAELLGGVWASEKGRPG